MQNITLNYFDFEGGAGEPIRNAFKLGGIAFTDARIPLSNWAETKKQENTYIFQQVPVLEVDSVPHAQSSAILRYAGKLGGLYPTDALEALRVDEILDCFMEMRGKLSVTGIVSSELSLAVREHVANFMNAYYAMIEKRIAANGTGYSVGNKLTIADLVLFNDATSPFYGVEVIDMAQHPSIMQVVTNVEAALAL